MFCINHPRRKARPQSKKYPNLCFECIADAVISDMNRKSREAEMSRVQKRWRIRCLTEQIEASKSKELLSDRMKLRKSAMAVFGE